MLKQRPDYHGYPVVHIKEGKKKFNSSCLVHRLIATAFIPNPNNLPEVNHKDGNKSNNSINNLEWCSRGDNVRHAYKTGLLATKPVRCVETGTVFPSVTAGLKFCGGRNKGRIRKSAMDNRYTAYGYHWEYV